MAGRRSQAVEIGGTNLQLSSTVFSVITLVMQKKPRVTRAKFKRDPKFEKRNADLLKELGVEGLYDLRNLAEAMNMSMSDCILALVRREIHENN